MRGPQGTGILCGRGDLIASAAANASPFAFVGRGMKVAKEEIMGLLTALDIFVEEDEQAENNRYKSMCSKVVDALIEFPGLKLDIKHDGIDYMVPEAVLSFTREWRGQSPDEVLNAMRQGEIPVHLNDLGNPDELSINPINLDDSELDVLISRLHEELIR